MEPPDQSCPHQNQLAVRPPGSPPQIWLQKELFHTVIDLAVELYFAKPESLYSRGALSNSAMRSKCAAGQP